MVTVVALVFHLAFVEHVLCYAESRPHYIDSIGVIPDDTLWNARGIMGWKSKPAQESGMKEIPTRQPFTRSQAEQICATAKLPQNIFFSAGSAENGAFGGRWMTSDGAELVQWIEDPLAWQKGTLRLNVAGTRLASIVPVEPDDEDIKKRWKIKRGKLGVSLKLRSNGDPNAEDMDKIAMKKELLSEVKVVLRDCDDQHLYTVWATTRFPKTVEIYNREDTLLARGEEVDPTLLGQPMKQRYWLFKDPKDKQMAKAGTPQLDGIKRGPPLQDSVPPWEMLFSPESSSPTSIARVLAAPNERWVIAAVLQWRVDYDMHRNQRSYLLAVLPPPLAMTCIAIFVLGMCFLSRLLFHCIFDLVYPPKRDENRNLYLFEWITELYGELIPRRLKHRGSSRISSPPASYTTIPSRVDFID